MKNFPSSFDTSDNLAEYGSLVQNLMSFMACITASGFPVSTEVSPPPLLCPFFALYVCYFHFYVESFFLVVFICCSGCLWVVMGISFPRLGKFAFIFVDIIFCVFHPSRFSFCICYPAIAGYFVFSWCPGVPCMLCL